MSNEYGTLHKALHFQKKLDSIVGKNSPMGRAAQVIQRLPRLPTTPYADGGMAAFVKQATEHRIEVDGIWRQLQGNRVHFASQNSLLAAVAKDLPSTDYTARLTAQLDLARKVTDALSPIATIPWLNRMGIADAIPRITAEEQRFFSDIQANAKMFGEQHAAILRHVRSITVSLPPAPEMADTALLAAMRSPFLADAIANLDRYQAELSAVDPEDADAAEQMLSSDVESAREHVSSLLAKLASMTRADKVTSYYDGLSNLSKAVLSILLSVVFTTLFDELSSIADGLVAVALAIRDDNKQRSPRELVKKLSKRAKVPSLMEDQVRFVTQDGLELFDEQSARAPVLATLSILQVVEIQEKRRNWCYIVAHFGNGTCSEGWVHTRYLKKFESLDF